MSLYNLRSADGAFRITKFDADLNPEASYLVTEFTCECPAGHRTTCRHRQMLPKLLPEMDQDRFYHFETGLWEPPSHNPAGQGPEPSTLAADQPSSPLVTGRGQPAQRRRLS